MKRTIIAHKKIIFNGNGYTDEWVEEAARRGLPNMKSTPDTLPCFIADKNISLFTKHRIYTESEIHSRYEILLENYCKTLHIEAKTLKDMIRKEYLPSLTAYTEKLALGIQTKSSVAQLPCTAERKLLGTLSEASEKLCQLEEALEADIATVEAMTDLLVAAKYYNSTVLADMNAIRTVADATEEYLPEDVLPYPNYEQLLFSL